MCCCGANIVDYRSCFSFILNVNKQGIFYGKNRPNYLNYGGIGWVIGHEITHGFDDRGKQFDATGNFKDWWNAETKERAIAKARCIVEQYGNYTATSVNMSINGINTQGENIADNGGLMAAYQGYGKLCLCVNISHTTLKIINI